MVRTRSAGTVLLLLLKKNPPMPVLELPRTAPPLPADAAIAAPVPVLLTFSARPLPMLRSSIVLALLLAVDVLEEPGRAETAVLDPEPLGRFRSR